jgi:hypothetical protein
LGTINRRLAIDRLRARLAVPVDPDDVLQLVGERTRVREAAALPCPSSGSTEWRGSAGRRAGLAGIHRLERHRQRTAGGLVRPARSEGQTRFVTCAFVASCPLE